METSKNISRRQFLQVTAVVAGSGGIINVPPCRSATLPIVEANEREIFLFSTHIAGTTHVERIGELESNLQIDDRLDLLREPDNSFDERAILVKNRSGDKLGYVPRAHNVIFSRLMDGGKALHARISSKEIHGSWHRIGINVYLHE